MEKIRVVLVVLDKKFLGNALKVLNYNNALPFVILMEDGDEKFITIGGKLNVQMLPFAFLSRIVEVGKKLPWVICGRTKNFDDVGKMKKFLSENGVPEKNIINFSFIESVNQAWLGNLRVVEEGGANCFATGDELTARGLSFKNLPDVRGVNLASDNQDLRQSLQIARHVFDKVKRGTIKFVFIGLAPYSLRVDARKNFSTCADDLLYAVALRENLQSPTDHDKQSAALLDGKFQAAIMSVTSGQADTNFDKLKTSREKKISVGDVTNWEAELSRVTKNFDAETVENNLRVLEDYIKLCIDNGAKPVGVLFPFATVLCENYSQEILLSLRRELQHLEKIYSFTLVDMSGAAADYDCFSDMTHLNLRGASIASKAIDFRLRGKDFFPAEKISRLNYDELFNVSNFLDKDAYNETIEKYFKLAAKNIRGKKKIRVGFVSDDPSMWCGDKLYNLFAKNKRCETTFFLCLQKSMRGQKLMEEDFQRGLDGFKSRGINVVGVVNDEQTVPQQDLLIF
ncbi:MAG: hypothetical protein IJS69_06220, partial [Selenomonadaceae bacterium]|nr:hypothetical protein [Selenomonadaceae bacterium]